METEAARQFDRHIHPNPLALAPAAHRRIGLSGYERWEREMNRQKQTDRQIDRHIHPTPQTVTRDPYSRIGVSGCGRVENVSFSEYGTCKTAKVRFWPWRSGKSP